MSRLEQAWYKGATWLYLLWPLSLLYQLIISIRRRRQQRKAAAPGVSVPVIVIGNISVGGTGKTPLLLSLLQALLEQGLKPGVISRGYGGKLEGSDASYPIQVTADSDPAVVGDEPAMIADRSGCPVVVDPDRRRALVALLGSHSVDVVLSDDGLQHYRLPRHMEIVVVDGERLFGNGLCLPAGPLREPLSRLREVDAVVLNGAPATTLSALSQARVMELRPGMLVNLKTGEQKPFHGAPFKLGDSVQAVAGIGNPQRFFRTLEQLPYPVQRFPFPDHHPYHPADFEAAGIDPQMPIVMTEKDGIKCRAFAGDNQWLLRVSAQLPDGLLEQVLESINRFPPQG